jgi:hypothetical protein
MYHGNRFKRERTIRGRRIRRRRPNSSSRDTEGTVEPTKRTEWILAIFGILSARLIGAENEL